MSTIPFSPDVIAPLLEGLAIMGTGGGGNPDWGKRILEQDLHMGRAWNVINPDDLPDDALVVSGGIMGSVKALEAIGFDNVLKGWEDFFPLQAVTQVMADLLGRPINAIVPFEAGGLNTPVIMTVGARLGIPVVNGDALGRSAPETQMTSFAGHGIRVTPMPLIDQYGNVVIVQDSVDATYADEVGRFVVSKGGYMGANNHYPMTGAQLKQTVIPHTITGALELGRKVEQARQDNADPIAAVRDYFKASRDLQFHGRVAALREEEHMGFYFTTVTLEGVGNSTDRNAELIIKNETMLYKLNGRTVCMFPDMALMLEPATGRGIMSVELTEGLELVVLALPCHPRLQTAALTEAGRTAMNPARYGQTELIYEPMS